MDDVIKKKSCRVYIPKYETCTLCYCSKIFHHGIFVLTLMEQIGNFALLWNKLKPEVVQINFNWNSYICT